MIILRKWDGLSKMQPDLSATQPDLSVSVGPDSVADAAQTVLQMQRKQCRRCSADSVADTIVNKTFFFNRLIKNK
jgi:hypothetical protein